MAIILLSLVFIAVANHYFGRQCVTARSILFSINTLEGSCAELSVHFQRQVYFSLKEKTIYVFLKGNGKIAVFIFIFFYFQHKLLKILINLLFIQFSVTHFV